MSASRFLYAEFEALPDMRDAVLALVRDYARRVQAEPGNRRFEAYTLESRPNRFFVAEEYVSEEAFQAHIAAPYCDAFNASLAPLAVGDGSRLTWLEPVR